MKNKIDAAEFLARLADRDAESDEGEEGGKIRNIMRLFVAGYTRGEIVKAGFNRSTVYRQTGEYLKLKKAPAVEFYGYPLYEARVQKLMKAKGLDRDSAIDLITSKDLEDSDDLPEALIEAIDEEELEDE